MTTLLRVERRNRVAILTLDQPDRLNAIGSEMLNELSAALPHCDADDEIGALVIAAEGKAFSAGADINEIAACHGPHEFAATVHRFTDTYGQLQRLPKPSVAAIDGI